MVGSQEAGVQQGRTDGPRRAPSRIPGLDGLRAISIALVLFAHTAGTRFFPSFTFARRNLGNFGVRVFFVISGFLITTLLLEELAKTGRISLRGFYMRRFFRIFPAAYCYLAVMAALAALGFVGLRAPDFLHAVTYTVNYQEVRPWLTIHLWSLSVEEQFYMLWPAVLVLSGRRRALWLAAGMIVLAPALRTLTYYAVPSLRWSVGASFQTNADALAAGCVLAGIRSRLWEHRRYRAFLESPWFLAAPAIALLACAAQQNAAFALPVGYTLMNLSIALCVDRAVRFEHDWAGRLLNARPVAFVGVLSYSIYLWQEPFLNRLSGSVTSWFPINLLCVAGAALLSYYCVESPFLELRKRLERRRQVKAAAA